MGSSAEVKFPGTNPRPLGFRGALVRLTADETVTDNSALDIPWDEAKYDTDDFWSAGSPTRLTIPIGSGITKVKVSANAVWAGGFVSPVRWYLQLKKNDSFDILGIGTFQDNHTTATANIPPANGVFTSVMEVDEGDYFELSIYQNTAGNEDLGSDGRTWFQIEVVDVVQSVNSYPPGMMMPYAGATEPTGWLFADGASLTTASFPGLFAAIGYTYGGSGADFNLPDLRGRYVVGMPVTTPTLGGTSGTPLTDMESIPAGKHSHADTIDTANEGAHTHLVYGKLQPKGGGINLRELTNEGNGTSNQSSAAGSNHKHTITGGVTDNVEAAGTNAPYIQLNHLIKT